MTQLKKTCRSFAVVLLLCLFVEVNGRAQAGASARDITFFVFSDIHVGAENPKAREPFTREDTLKRVTTNVNVMRGLAGKPYPERPVFDGVNLRVVSQPRGLIVLGDVTDGHKDPEQQAEQWNAIETLFPSGSILFGKQVVPVFAMPGNHDGNVLGPQRQGMIQWNRRLEKEGKLSAISSNGVHYALNWDGVHLLSLGLCPADDVDDETPFKYRGVNARTWNDPQGSYSFLKNYLETRVQRTGEPVILMFHYGFDGFSMNDWNWWTLKQRRALYELIKDYNVAAIMHGHDHHADHYLWPDARLHAKELASFYDGNIPRTFRQYDVISCGSVCWVMRIRGNQLIGAHFKGADWSTSSNLFFVKNLQP